MHQPVTISSSDGSTYASIVPTRGLTCIDFGTRLGDQRVRVLDTEPAFLTGEARAGRSGIPLLFPFPNRIREGQFNHRGQAYHVPPPDWFPQTIHGFCLDCEWRIVESAPDRLVGEFLLSRDAPDRRAQWPADAKLTVTYTVTPQTLRADIVVENPDTVPLPWGFGTHPYFRLPLSGDHTPTSCLVTADAARLWDLVECYPTGDQSAVSSEKDLRRGWRYGTIGLDDVYTALTPRDGIMQQSLDDPVGRVRLTQRSCDAFRELVVFTPKDRSVICLEPYTCVTDAANLQARGIDSGWRELPPGARAELWFELVVSPIE